MTAKSDQFIQYLTDLAQSKDRGPLATLRRSLAFEPGSYVPAFRYIETWVPDNDAWPREVYYLVAALFALHPSVGPTTLPAAMAEVRIKRKSASIEARFLALLDSDRDQLPRRLRQAVDLIRAQDLPLNWTRSLTDFLGWFRTDRKVQRQWAREFYRTATGESSPPEEAGKG